MKKYFARPRYLYAYDSSFSAESFHLILYLVSSRWSVAVSKCARKQLDSLSLSLHYIYTLRANARARERERENERNEEEESSTRHARDRFPDVDVSRHLLLHARVSRHGVEEQSFFFFFFPRRRRRRGIAPRSRWWRGRRSFFSGRGFLAHAPTLGRVSIGER